LVQYVLFEGILSQKFIILYMFIPALTAFAFFMLGKKPVRTQLSLFTSHTTLLQWAFALLYPIFMFIIVTMLGVLTGLGKFNPDFLLKVLSWPFLSSLAVLFIAMLPSMFGEEYGWRGYLLPALTKKYSKLQATLVLGLVWGLWHIPSYYIVYSKAGIGDPLLLTIMGVFTVAAGAFPYTYLFLLNGNIFPCVLLHGMYNLAASQVFLGSPVIAGLLEERPGILMVSWPHALVLMFVTASILAIFFARQFNKKGL
jgi:membrane protease YdiL (CAAX protease family)